MNRTRPAANTGMARSQREFGGRESGGTPQRSPGMYDADARDDQDRLEHEEVASQQSRSRDDDMDDWGGSRGVQGKEEDDDGGREGGIGEKSAADEGDDDDDDRPEPGRLVAF